MIPFKTSHKYSNYFSRLAWVVTIFIFGYLVVTGAMSTDYQWDWSAIPSFFFDWQTMKPGPLWFALVITFKIIVCSLGLTFILGLATALARLLGGPVLGAVAKIYLEVVRNTPLLIQLIVIYFIFGEIFNLPRFWAAVIALSLFEGAYLSEIFRGSILAVDRGQWQAAWCLGLSTPTTFRRVILPQSVPMVLPSLASLVISLVKDSALASAIAVSELTRVTKTLVSETYLDFELWLTIAAVYLIINVLISQVGHILERRFSLSSQAVATVSSSPQGCPCRGSGSTTHKYH